MVSFSTSDISSDIPVCQNLADHVNSSWLAANPVPADRSTWGSFETLGERSLGIQKQIVEAAGANTAATGIEKLIGDIWATGMDQAAVNAAGISPIADELARIDALKDGKEIAQYLRESAARGEGFLFGFGPAADFKDSNMNIAYATQGGLGLPDPSVYTSDREDHQKNRADYLLHITKLLKLAGDDEASAEQKAEQIMAFETRLAKVSLTRE